MFVNSQMHHKLKIKYKNKFNWTQNRCKNINCETHKLESLRNNNTQLAICQWKHKINYEETKSKLKYGDLYSKINQMLQYTVKKMCEFVEINRIMSFRHIM